MTPSLVAPSPMYRVISGRCAGQIVPESETVLCESEFGGCNGYGEHFHRWHRSMDFGPAEQSYGTTCPVCGGVGRVLGWPSESHMEVQRLEVLRPEGPSEESKQSAA